MRMSRVKAKELAQKTLVVFIVSFAFFFGLSIRYKLYAILAICVCLFTIISYKVRSRAVYREIVMLLLSNGIAYVIAKWIVTRNNPWVLLKLILNGKLHVDRLSFVLTVVHVLFLLVMIVVSLLKKVKKGEQLIELYPQRKKDLERIKNYLAKFSAIGVNGVWGSGKTILINRLIKDLSNSYEFVVIDLLSCDLDEVQIIILDEMQKVFNRHRIFSKHSSQLKRLLGAISWLDKLQGIVLPESVSYRAALDGFKDDLELLGKKIVIVFEDIDRINDEKIIKKIFSIAEHLCSIGVKVIYQYDQHKFNEYGDGKVFDRWYTEKYIPFVVNLTEINLVTAIEFGLREQEIDSKILNMDDFMFLRIPVRLDYHLERTFDTPAEWHIQTFEMGLRRPHQYLTELYECLQWKDSYKDEVSKRTAIAFFCIKHFFDDLNKKMNVAESPLDTLTLKHMDNQYTLKQLVAMAASGKLTEEQIREIISAEENAQVLAVLHLLKYNFDFGDNEQISDHSKLFENILDKAPEDLAKKHTNEKIDRIIWNLLSNGKTSNTDYENAVEQVIAEILDKPIEEQHGAYTAFCKRMFDQRDESGDRSDNETIFRLGVPPFVEIFRAFRVVRAPSAVWMKLVDFYFRNEEIDKITPDVIATLRYCYFASEQLYIHVIKKFNSLSVIGNMNDQKPYTSFLLHFLEALSRIGYLNTHDIGMIQREQDIKSQMKSVQHVLDDYRNKLTQLHDSIPIVQAQANLDIVIEFIEKNNEIIESIKKLEPPGPRITTTMSSRLPHQEEVDRLVDLKADEERFMQEVEKSYAEERITVYEISSLPKADKLA